MHKCNACPFFTPLGVRGDGALLVGAKKENFEASVVDTSAGDEDATHEDLTAFWEELYALPEDGEAAEQDPSVQKDLDEKKKELLMQLLTSRKTCPACGRLALPNCDECEAPDCDADPPEDWKAVSVPNVLTAFIYGLKTLPDDLEVTAGQETESGQQEGQEHLTEAYLDKLRQEKENQQELRFAIRYEDKQHVVFDAAMLGQDTEPLLPLTRAHVISLLTDIYIPDIRYLFTNPSLGLTLVTRLEDAAWRALYTHDKKLKDHTVLNSTEWMNSAMSEIAAAHCSQPGEGGRSTIRDCTMACFKLPAHHDQLHLEYALPPLLPIYSGVCSLEEDFFIRGQHFPLKYIVEALCAFDDAQRSIEDPEGLTAESLIEAISSIAGLDYDKAYDLDMNRFNRNSEILANYKQEDFSKVLKLQDDGQGVYEEVVLPDKTIHPTAQQAATAETGVASQNAHPGADLQGVGSQDVDLQDVDLQNAAAGVDVKELVKSDVGAILGCPKRRFYTHARVEERSGVRRRPQPMSRFNADTKYQDVQAKIMDDEQEESEVPDSG